MDLVHNQQQHPNVHSGGVSSPSAPLPLTFTSPSSFVDTFCEQSLRSVDTFLDTFCEKFLDPFWWHFFWSLFVDTFVETFCLTLFVETFFYYYIKFVSKFWFCNHLQNMTNFMISLTHVFFLKISHLLLSHPHVHSSSPTSRSIRTETNYLHTTINFVYQY